MMPTPDPTTNVAVELAQMRGEIRTGLVDIKGSLTALVERTNRTDADLRQLRHDMERDLEALQKEVDELKRGRWPLAQLSVLITLGALATAVVTLLLA